MLKRRRQLRPGEECERCRQRSCMCKAMEQARLFNDAHPVGTPVRYWRGIRQGEGTLSKTRTPAWALYSGDVVVSVEGSAGGIALTHVEVVRGA